jgi:hypothetical protein
MKHLATIQMEFLKEARKWDDLSYEEQKGYLQRHPKSKRHITVQPNDESSEQTQSQNNLSDSTTNLATNLVKSYDIESATGSADFEIESIDDKIMQIATTKADPVYTSKVKIASIEHWNPIHQKTILRLQKYPHEIRNYDISGNTTAAQGIEHYRNAIAENREEVQKIKDDLNQLNTLTQNDLARIDLNDLKDFSFAIITPNKRKSFFMFSKDKEKLLSLLKHRTGSKKVINPSKKNSIMKTISPYFTTLAILKMKENIS